MLSNSNLQLPRYLFTASTGEAAEAAEGFNAEIAEIAEVTAVDGPPKAACVDRLPGMHKTRKRRFGSCAYPAVGPRTSACAQADPSTASERTSRARVALVGFLCDPCDLCVCICLRIDCCVRSSLRRLSRRLRGEGTPANQRRFNSQ